ncbi:MAG: hypothetical protein QOJ63_1808, partial [Solirubrobacteraceae bacterium]|nr:hypothetical protein [Solirubrobacteraceae bacterium]
MPLRNYGALRGSVIDHRLASGSNAHFQLHVVDDATHYRIAVNVESQMQPSELEFLIDSNFHHPVLETVAALPVGWSALRHEPADGALDFIRGNLFDRDQMRKLPFDVPGPDNDLNEKLALYVRRAIADEHATAYAFGERWGPEQGKTDKIFGFAPGNGVHDIHMNQANVGKFVGDDGVFQDGALLLHFPAPEQWVAIFLKFQSQTWHTDDVTGHQIGDAPPPDSGGGPGAPGEPPIPEPAPRGADGAVRVVAALANAVRSPETEFVTLLNTTAADLDLTGWKLVDRDRHTMALQGTIAAGETLRVQLTPQVVLPNKGGVITLLDAGGLKVDGVAYTREQA